tara:strand:- start:1250 stop:1435 length:186 start_codon:yes stop_codon:yes gene_type:complete
MINQEKYDRLLAENVRLEEQLKRAQHDLVESVRSELDYMAEIQRLRDQLTDLGNAVSENNL